MIMSSHHDKTAPIMVIICLILAALILILSGCPHPPVPPTPPVPPPDTMPICDIKMLPKSDDICPSLFTQDGYACARCPENSGCIDMVDGVYCAISTCLHDPACVSEVTLETKVNSKRKKR